MPATSVKRPARRPAGRPWMAAMAAGLLILAVGAGVAVWWQGGRGGIDHRDAALVAVGEKVYGDACASCHGLELQGERDWQRRLDDGTLPPPPHDASGHTWHHPDGVLFEYTKHGGAPFAPPGFKSAMPPFAETLSDREIWAALSFIKSRWPPDIQERHSRINASAR